MHTHTHTQQTVVQSAFERGRPLAAEPLLLRYVRSGAAVAAKMSGIFVRSILRWR